MIVFFDSVNFKYRTFLGLAFDIFTWQSFSRSHLHLLKMHWPLEHLKEFSLQVVRLQSASSLQSVQSLSKSQRHNNGMHFSPLAHANYWSSKTSVFSFVLISRQPLPLLSHRPVFDGDITGATATSTIFKIVFVFLLLRKKLN
jgi:hypothetical protein